MAKSYLVELALGLILLLILLYSILKGSAGTAQASSSGSVNCLPFSPTRHGPANITVTSKAAYDSFTQQNVCPSSEVTVNITGALPGDYFEVFQNALIIFRNGSTSRSYNWDKLADGKADLNGNLTINTYATNPSSLGEARITIGVKDSSCENVLVTDLPQTLCSERTYLKESGYRQLTFKQWSDLLDKAMHPKNISPHASE